MIFTFFPKRPFFRLSSVEKSKKESENIFPIWSFIKLVSYDGSLSRDFWVVLKYTNNLLDRLT